MTNNHKKSSSLRDIKKEFAKEHVKKIGYINGFRYFFKKTNLEISKEMYTNIMSGNY